MKTIESLLSEDIKGLGNIAQKMGKALPRFIFRTDSSLFLRREIEAPLHAAFTHSLRNSIDHGIEKPDERTIKGKQAQGSIYISSEMSSDGTSVVIEIRDDGAGLKLDRIAAKACETGLINSPDLSSMSEEQIADLVFQPGFSTARNLTDISGRGVGMDSIRKAITDIGGDVRIILKGRLNDGAQAFATRLIIPIQHFDVWRVELTQQAA
jgi:chemotaxis protein histidine kinase CheA